MESAMTFDDGAHAIYTYRVWTIHRQYRMKATFFCIGRHVAACPDLFKEARAAGQVKANQSWSHPSIAFLPRCRILLQLTCTSRAIQHIIGIQPIFFRPPYWAFSVQVPKQSDQAGMTTTDRAQPGIAGITARILGQSTHGPGGSMLLHDGGREFRNCGSASRS